MNIEWFISKKLAFSAKRSFSRFIISIAIAAVTLSVTVMILAVSLVNGFQHEIESKIYGFWGHIHVTPYGFGRSFEDNPIERDEELISAMAAEDNVRHVQVFAQKGGIMMVDDQFEGITLRGVGADFDWTFFESRLEEGRVLQLNDSQLSREIVVSAITAKRLDITVGDKVQVHFIESAGKPTRKRQLEVVGIYSSGLAEYDRYFALVDIGQIQRLNNWDDDQIGGYELLVEDVHQLDATTRNIDQRYLNFELIAQTLRQIYPNIFDWVAMQSVNEVIILVIMVFVAIINMITCLLILILERTNMIGIMKALGARDWTMQKIFVYNGAIILGTGLLLGNLLGIGLCVLQQQFGLVTLPEESYYVSEAPVQLQALPVILINAGTFVVCSLVLLLPSFLVSRITPIRAIRFS